MNICEDTSYKHLEDFIQRHLSSEDKVIDEVNLSIDHNQLEHSLVPFICKIHSKNAVKPFNSITSRHFCDIDYDNSENQVTEMVEDSCVKRNTILDIDSEDFNNSTLLDDDNHLNRKGKNGINKDKLFSSTLCNNNNKLHNSFSEWNNHKSFPSSKPSKTVSAFNRTHHQSTKSELLTFSNEGNGGKPESFLQSARKGHVLKENNCSDLSWLSRKVKHQFYCDSHKLSLANAKDNKNHFDLRAQQENSLVHAEVESIERERICTDEESDSDEELLKVPVALLHHKEPSGKAVELTKGEKCLKTHFVSCLNLDKIIEIRKSEMERMLKSQELVSENNFEVCRDTYLLELMRQTDGHELEQDRTVGLPPGLEIFNLQIFHYFCPLHRLSLKSCGFFGDKGTELPLSPIEKKLARMPNIEVQDMIALGVMKIHLNSALFKEALLKYLFKILSAHNNERLTYACEDTFFWYINSAASGRNSFYWYPSMTDVIATILNYGISMTKNNCPVKDILLNVEKTLELSEHCSCFGKENNELSLVINGLSRIIEIFTLFLKQKCLHTYYQEEICDFILLLCWLSLDIRLLGKWIEVKIGRCIAAGLEIISASNWPHKMKYLAEKLAELGGHHRNTLYIALGLRVSERGLHLQRAVSFLAIQYLLKAENPCFFADVTPFMLLELLKLKPLHHIKDYFLLHSIVSLLDLCVENKALPLHRDAIRGMCRIALSIYNKIGKTFQYPERTKVKALLLRVYGKWSFLILNMPRKMEMFTSVDHTECEESLEPHYVPEVKEMG